MISRAAVLLWILGCFCFAQTSSIRASVSEETIRYCRQSQSGNFDVGVSTHFALENLSTRRVLVARTIDIIPSVRVASSPENMRKGIFVLNMTEEYSFGERTLAPPKLSDFAVIEPGGTQVVKLASVTIAASKTLSSPSGLRLSPGKYWVQFGFSTLPAYFAWKRGELDSFRKKWSARGYLSDETVWTEPFPITVTLDDKYVDCSSE